MIYFSLEVTFNDIYSAGASLAELINSIQEGNAQDSLINGGILLFDLAALFIPGLPGVGGFKTAANAAETGADVVKAIAKNGDEVIEGAGDVAKGADKVDNAIDATKAENLAKYVDGKSPTSGFKPGKPFRDGVTELMGNPRPGDQAHHVLPQKWIEKFNALDIDIHDPQFGVWWNETPHGKQSTAYNKEWEAFFVDPSRTKDDVFKFADDLSEKFGYEWSPPRVD